GRRHHHWLYLLYKYTDQKALYAVSLERSLRWPVTSQIARWYLSNSFPCQKAQYHTLNIENTVRRVHFHLISEPWALRYSNLYPHQQNMLYADTCMPAH